MTDTRFFTATAIDRKTNEWKKFFSLVPFKAGKAAREWLASK